MEFLILGALEVSDDGRKLALGGPKQRAVAIDWSPDGRWIIAPVRTRRPSGETRLGSC